ncbi:MAG TPA: hypothetical protein VK277_03365 [Acidimicrobiales bacterium]|nr:hypothetical protein [Acidimicrobiales bacterium]
MPSGQTNNTQDSSQVVADLVNIWVQLWSLPFKCFSGLLGSGTMPSQYQSMTFDFPAAAGLTLVPGPLQLGIAQLGGVAEHLPSAAVSCNPSTLDATHTTFRLVVDSTQLQGSPGGTYVGQVTAQLDPNNPQPNPPSLPVWIVIP